MNGLTLNEGSGTAALLTGKADIQLHNLRMMGGSRPLLEATSSVNLTNTTLSNNVGMYAGAISFSPTTYAHLNITDLTATGLTSPLITTSPSSIPDITIDGLQMFDTYEVLENPTGAITLSVSNATIQQIAPLSEAFDLNGVASIASFTQTSIENINGTFLTISDGSAFIDGLQSSNTNRLLHAINHSDVTLLDVQYEYSDSLESDIEIDKSLVLLSNSRFLDVTTQAPDAGPPVLARTPVFNVTGTSGDLGQLLIDSSLIWSFGGGNVITVDQGTVDLTATTLYSDTLDSRILGLGGSLDQISLNQVLFYDQGASPGCAVEAGGTTAIFSTDVWMRTAVENTGACSTLTTPTYEFTTGAPNFTFLSRIPLNSVVRNGWGEFSN